MLKSADTACTSSIYAKLPLGTITIESIVSGICEELLEADKDIAAEVKAWDKKWQESLASRARYKPGLLWP